MSRVGDALKTIPLRHTCIYICIYINYRTWKTIRDALITLKHITFIYTILIYINIFSTLYISTFFRVS